MPAYQLIIVWSVVGFPLLAALTTAFGIRNTTLSFSFRTIVVFAALTLVVKKSKNINEVAFLAFITFWTAYFVRLFYDLHVLEIVTSKSIEHYWLWGLGGCFLPGLAILVNSQSTFLNGLFSKTYAIVCLAVILLLIFGGTDYFSSSAGQIVDINRWNVDALNPISMGAISVTVVLLGVSILITNRAGNTEKCIGLISIIIGVYLLVLANSRGPIVGLVVALFFLLTSRWKRRKTISLLVTLGFVSTYFLIFQSDALSDGILSRFFAIFQSSDGRDLATQGRLISFNGAWNQFLNSPIVGDQIEERITRFYPHNVMLESLMASGIIGGLPFFFLVGLAIKSSWQLIKFSSDYLWVGLITIQYIVSAQFSGAIYSVTAIWVLIPLSINLARQLAIEKRADDIRLLPRQSRDRSSEVYSTTFIDNDVKR